MRKTDADPLCPLITEDEDPFTPSKGWAVKSMVRRRRAGAIQASMFTVKSEPGRKKTQNRWANT